MATTTTISQVQFRTVDGVSIRYADSGDSQEPALLLTSPWPESVYAFAPIWATLAEQARLQSSSVSRWRRGYSTLTSTRRSDEE
jgi:hypothetical protein